MTSNADFYRISIVGEYSKIQLVKGNIGVRNGIVVSASSPFERWRGQRYKLLKQHYGTRFRSESLFKGRRNGINVPTRSTEQQSVLQMWL